MFTLGRAVWKISRACGLKCHNNGMSNGVDHADGGVAERKSVLESLIRFTIMRKPSYAKLDLNPDFEYESTTTTCEPSIRIAIVASAKLHYRRVESKLKPSSLSNNYFQN